MERDRGFRVGRSLVSPQDTVVPILVCNPGPTPITLYRGMTLAMLEEVRPLGTGNKGSNRGRVAP